MQIFTRSIFDVNRRAAPAAETLQSTTSKSLINKTNIVFHREAAIGMEQSVFSSKAEAATHRKYPND